MSDGSVIPSWFQLDNYTRTTASMGLAEWAAALEPRAMLWKVLTQLDNPRHALLLSQEKTRNDLLETFSNCTRLKFGGPHDFGKFYHDTGTVRTGEIGDIALAWDSISRSSEVAPFADRLLRYLSGVDAAEEEKIEALVQLPAEAIFGTETDPFLFVTEGEVFAIVNIDAPDERLIEDFKAWLTVRRREVGLTGKKKRFSRKDFEEWHEKRVLAYADLMIYSLLSNIPITQHQLGVTLFPDDFDTNPADRIRRTIKPAAEDFLSVSTCRAITHQAALET